MYKKVLHVQVRFLLIRSIDFAVVLIAVTVGLASHDFIFLFTKYINDRLAFRSG